MRIRIDRIAVVFVFLTSVLTGACKRKDRAEYVEWYRSIASSQLHMTVYTLEIKEYPMELAWMAFYGNRLDSYLLDSLRENKPDIVHLKVTVKKDPSQPRVTGIDKKNADSEFLKFGVDGKRVVNVVRESAISKDKAGEFLLTINTVDIKDNSELNILDITNYQYQKIELSKILLRDYKELEI